MQAQKTRRAQIRSVMGHICRETPARHLEDSRIHGKTLTCRVVKSHCLTWLACSAYSADGARLSDRTVRCWSMFPVQLRPAVWQIWRFVSELCAVEDPWFCVVVPEIIQFSTFLKPHLRNSFKKKKKTIHTVSKLPWFCCVENSFTVFSKNQFLLKMQFFVKPHSIGLCAPAQTDIITKFGSSPNSYLCSPRVFWDCLNPTALANKRNIRSGQNNVFFLSLSVQAFFVAKQIQQRRNNSD